MQVQPDLQYSGTLTWPKNKKQIIKTDLLTYLLRNGLDKKNKVEESEYSGTLFQLASNVQTKVQRNSFFPVPPQKIVFPTAALADTIITEKDFEINQFAEPTPESVTCRVERVSPVPGVIWEVSEC